MSDEVSAPGGTAAPRQKMKTNKPPTTARVFHLPNYSNVILLMIFLLSSFPGNNGGPPSRIRSVSLFYCSGMGGISNLL